MFNGQTMKTARKAKHLSQKQLAFGITSQTTISQLEANQVVPSFDIIAKLATKLDIPTDDLTEDIDLVRAKNNLIKADSLVKNYDYTGAKELLNKINTENLLDVETKNHFEFLKADCNMWISKDFKQGIFDFNKILITAKKNNIYTALATCQLGVAYDKLSEPEQADFFFEQISGLLAKSETSKNVFWTLFILSNTVMYFMNRNDFKASIETGKKALEFSNAHGSTYFIAELCFSIATSLQQETGWTRNALEYLIQAWSFAKLTNNKSVMGHAEEYMIQNKLLPK